MSAHTGPLQVVPDIDNTETEEPQFVPTTPALPLPGQSDLEVKLRQANMDASLQATAKDVKIVLPRRIKPPQGPSIRRMNSDAQPLTSAEMMAHRHLIPPS